MCIGINMCVWGTGAKQALTVMGIDSTSDLDEHQQRQQFQ